MTTTEIKAKIRNLHLKKKWNRTTWDEYYFLVAQLKKIEKTA